MFFNLLNLAATYTFDDCMMVFIIGFGTVFVVLTLLILILWLQSKIIVALTGKKKEKVKEIATSSAIEYKPALQTSAEVEDDSEVAAAIAAAVYAMCSSPVEIRKIREIKKIENPEFVVRPLKKRGR